MKTKLTMPPSIMCVNRHKKDAPLPGVEKYHDDTCWQAHGEEIIELRRGGKTLQEIGDRFDFSRQRIWQLLMEHCNSSLTQPRPADIKRICEVCGKEFSVRPYEIRSRSPYRFCSQQCKGSWLGKWYGFGPDRKTGRQLTLVGISQ